MKNIVKTVAALSMLAATTVAVSAPFGTNWGVVQNLLIDPSDPIGTVVYFDLDRGVPTGKICDTSAIGKPAYRVVFQDYYYSIFPGLYDLMEEQVKMLQASFLSGVRVAAYAYENTAGACSVTVLYYEHNF